MTRSPLLALATGLALALAAPAQDRAPEVAAARAYARLEEKLGAVQAAPPAEREAKYEELFAECGAFLDAHLQAATDEQLTQAAGLWLSLAERLKQPDEAVRRRIDALRARPRELPAELKQLVARAEAKLGLRPGATAPAWAEADLVSGERVTLAGLRGKRVLMVFWATSNEHSVRLLQERVRALHERHAKAGLTVVGVGVPIGNDTAAAEKGLVEELRWPWRSVFDRRGAIAEAYGVDAVPHVALIDAEGLIVEVGPAETTMPKVERALR